MSPSHLPATAAASLVTRARCVDTPTRGEDRLVTAARALCGQVRALTHKLEQQKDLLNTSADAQRLLAMLKRKIAALPTDGAPPPS